MQSNAGKVIFSLLKAVAWLVTGAVISFAVLIVFALISSGTSSAVTEFTDSQEQVIAQYVGLEDVPESFEIIKAEYVSDAVSGNTFTVQFSADAGDTAFAYADYNNLKIIDEKNGTVVMQATVNISMTPELDEIMSMSDSKPKTEAWTGFIIAFVIALGAMVMAVRSIIKMVRILKED